jgi:hypothetical protein
VSVEKEGGTSQKGRQDVSIAKDGRVRGSKKWVILSFNSTRLHFIRLLLLMMMMSMQVVVETVEREREGEEESCALT